MYRKHISISKQHALGGKEAKRFRKEIEKKHPKLTENEIEALIPGKNSITVSKLSNKTLVYSNKHGNPIFFDPSSHGDDLMPTIYALSIVPLMIESLTTFTPVSQKILGGADLFLQGIAEVLNDSIEPFHVNSVRSVKVVDNPMPFCVGRMKVSLIQAQGEGMKGKGLEVVHCYGDFIWNMGTREGLNSGFNGVTEGIKAISSNEMMAEEENIITKNIDNAFIDDLDESEGDIILDIATGAAKNLKTNSLPISITDFFTKCMQPLKPKHATLDVKKSKYKKLSNLLYCMEKDGMLEIKQIRKEPHIVQVHREHLKISSWSMSENLSMVTEAKNSGIMSIKRLLRAPPSFKPVFNCFEKDALFSSEEVIKIAEHYVDSQLERLSDPAYCKPNDFCTRYLYNNIELPHYKVKVCVDDVVKRIVSKMQIWHEIVRQNGTEEETIRNKGELIPLKIIIEKRLGRKVTSIVGCERFGYDAGELASVLQRRMKTACYLHELPGTSGVKEICMGGAWIGGDLTAQFDVQLFFTNDQGIPKSMVEVINKLKINRRC